MQTLTKLVETPLGLIRQGDPEEIQKDLNREIAKIERGGGSVITILPISYETPVNNTEQRIMMRHSIIVYHQELTGSDEGFDCMYNPKP